jgi:endonuclease IV
MLSELDLVVAGRALARLGVRYVVMHAGMYPADRRAQSLELLHTALGPETTQTSDGRYVWRLSLEQG